MSVFISYRHTDRDKAYEIYYKLERNGIHCYFDVIDEESTTTDDITQVITKNIKKCSHLLAIISESTNNSWWVPFEIGEATALNRRICSYAFQNNEHTLLNLSLKRHSQILPEYLQKWPVLSSDIDIKKFIKAYRDDTESILSLEESRGFKSETFTKKGADLFHNNLKNIL